jgi:uncharacterized membrane protein (DUF485 family)
MKNVIVACAIQVLIVYLGVLLLLSFDPHWSLSPNFTPLLIKVYILRKKVTTNAILKRITSP